MLRNAEHLRKEKHRAFEQNKHLRAEKHELELRLQQYKSLYEQAQMDAQCRGGGELEMQSLRQQLEAVLLLKDALNSENLEIRRRLEEAESTRQASKEANCVICMDNLINVVCLPCKHLSMCTYCGMGQDVTSCPICRTEIKEKMQIFTP